MYSKIYSKEVESYKEIWDNFDNKTLRDSWTDYAAGIYITQHKPSENGIDEAIFKFYSKFFTPKEIECILWYAKRIYFYDYFCYETIWRERFLEAFNDTDFDKSVLYSTLDYYEKELRSYKELFLSMFSPEELQRIYQNYGDYEGEMRL